MVEPQVQSSEFKNVDDAGGSLILATTQRTLMNGALPQINIVTQNL